MIYTLLHVGVHVSSFCILHQYILVLYEKSYSAIKIIKGEIILHITNDRWEYHSIKWEVTHGWLSNTENDMFVMHGHRLWN